MSGAEARRAGPLERLGRGLQSFLAALLAVGAAVLAIDLSDARYARVDLSGTRSNTLDPELMEILDRLPEPARIDLFLRPLEPPYDVTFAEASGRFLDELQRIVGARRDVLEVVDYDPADLEGSLARQDELGVEGSNIVVVSCGARRTTLRLFSDIAVVDWGNPRPEQGAYLHSEGITNIVDPNKYQMGVFEMARVGTVRGASALAEALLRVGGEDAPLAVFVQGHGESDGQSQGTEGLSSLRALLEDEGFETQPWLGARAGALPEEADLVLLVGPRQPLPAEDLAALDDYVEAGGNLVVAPWREEVFRDEFDPGTDAAEDAAPAEGRGRGALSVLARAGLRLERGVVCLPLPGRGGEPIMGNPAVTRFHVRSSGLATSHPVTVPLRSDDRSVEFALSSAFAQNDLATVGNGVSRTQLTLVSAPQGAWLDLPLEEDGERLDYILEPGRETSRRRLPLVKVVDAHGTGGRVLGIASSTFLENALFASNRDFLRNASNWLASRETRLRIAPRDPLSSRIELREGRALSTLSWLLWGALPLLCGLVAGVVAWRRRRA